MQVVDFHFLSFLVRNKRSISAGGIFIFEKNTGWWFQPSEISQLG
jgi:hypothetical protein